jgi:DNA processing protein
MHECVGGSEGSGESPVVYAAALAGLPGMTPVRLARLLDEFDPAIAWHAVAAGTHPCDPERRFESAASSTDVTTVGEAYVEAGVSILLRDAVGYPARLVGDRGQPAVLFARGDPSCVDRQPSAAIVGTRSATHYGRCMAAEIAGDLSAAGVTVVSGLAKGIDGAAHTAVVRRHDRVGEPVAVVGTGLDVPYPRNQSALWAAVGEHGAVVSEQPLGTLPRPGVFPARNRIIAALSDVVVLVECHPRGGSLYTAEAAARRGIPVGAVPGSVRSPASSGCNALIADGCFPVRDADDVLCAIELARVEPVARPLSHHQNQDHQNIGRQKRLDGGLVGQQRRPRHAAGRPKVERASDEQRRVLEAVDDHPTGLETILLRTGLPIATVALACEELVDRQAVVTGPGWWARA